MPIDDLPRAPSALLLIPLLAACATRAAAPAAAPTETAVLWVRTAAEYRAAATQAYRTAAARLGPALADSGSTALPEQQGRYDTLPPAVVLDVDETVLDNSPYQARLLERGSVYSDSSWLAWVREAAAPAVPGALEFVRQAAARGVTPIYVTNRDAASEEATRRNLEALGFPLDDTVDVLLTERERPDWTSDKSSRRAFVARRYRVLLLVGDDLNDFVPAGRLAPEAREALVRRHEDRWGRSWIMLPNPVYGSWERALRRRP